MPNPPAEHYHHRPHQQQQQHRHLLPVAVRVVQRKLGWREVGDDEDWEIYWTDTSVGIERIMKLTRTQVGTAHPHGHVQQACGLCAPDDAGSLWSPGLQADHSLGSPASNSRGAPGAVP